MAIRDGSSRRPSWVRLAVREGTTRRSVLTQSVAPALIAVAGLFMLVSGAVGATTDFWRTLLVVGGIVLGLLGVLVASLAWLAVRWVDQHGGWHKPAALGDAGDGWA
jgi:hypothetical protein